MVKTTATLGLALALAARLVTDVAAHGYLTKPKARQLCYNDMGPDVNSGNPLALPSLKLVAHNQMNLNGVVGGGPGGYAWEWTTGPGKMSHSACGDASAERVKWDAKQTNGSSRIIPGGAFDDDGTYGMNKNGTNTVSNEVYVEGGNIKFEVDITAFHWGWFEFRLCDHKNYDKTTWACLNEHVLRFDKDTIIQEYNANVATNKMRQNGCGTTNWGHECPTDPTDYNGLSEHNRCSGKNINKRWEAKAIVPSIVFFPKGTCCDKSGGYNGTDMTTESWPAEGNTFDCSKPEENDQRWVLPGNEKSQAYTGKYTMTYKLPEGVVCEDTNKPCTVQWLYMTGNSPDNFPEIFLNCADITIKSKSSYKSLTERPTPNKLRGSA